PAPGKDHALVLDHAGLTLMHGLAEEPVVWTLATDQRAVSAEQYGRGQNAKPALTTCPECKAIRRQGQPCPECGWRPRPKPQPVDVIDRDLVLVGSAKEPWTLAQRQQFYRELLGHARRKGWR